MKLGIRTRSIAVVAVTLLVTLMSLVNDICAHSCDRQADERCPLHSPQPVPRCTHDHSSMTADVPRTQSSSAASDAQPAIALFASVAAVQPVATGSPQTSFRHSPPQITEPRIALRI